MRPVLVAVVIILALAGQGCASPAPTTSDPYSTDQQIAVAAEAAFGSYISATSAVLGGGGEDPWRIDEHVTESRKLAEDERVAEFVDNGWQLSGPVSALDFSVTKVANSGAAGIEVTATACLDSTGLQIIDPMGTEIGPDVVDRQPVEVVLVAEQAKRLRVDWVYENVGTC